MAVIESATQPGVSMEIGRSFRAGRVEVRPLEYRSLSGEVVGGHYRTALPTGLITVLNAADAILSLRWTSVNKFLVLHRLRLWAVITTAFTNAQEVSFDLVKVNGFIASDTGGTATQLAALQAGAGRKSLVMAPSAIADVRIATTVALGAGTGVAEGVPNGFAALPIGNAVGSSAAETLYDIAEQSGEHPLIIGPQEGFRVRIGQTQGAVGVMRVTAMLDWAEVAAY
jgi:hypothetical protein